MAAIAVLLLALHYTLAVGSKVEQSTTSDELVHLTAGFSYWQHHDYRLHPENGILPQRLAALPAWLAGTRFPELSGNDYWRTSDAWVVGHQFFYESGDDHFPRLMAGRAVIAVFSTATGLLVFIWSRRLMGNASGLISLGFFSLCPSFLAHGALVTSDAVMAFFFLAAITAWWWHLHDPRFRWWLLAAIALGLAFVSKFSAVLLVPMLGLLAVWRAWSPQPLMMGPWLFSSRLSRLAAITASTLLQGAVVAAVIWTCYGFRYSAFNPALPAADHFIRPWHDLVEPATVSGATIQFFADHRLLPEAYLYGFAYVLKTTAARSAFLNGEYSVTGWPTFFLWAFLLKSTLGFLGALLLAGVNALIRLKRLQAGWAILSPVAPLIVLFGVYAASSLSSQLNIGHRHLLPLYPVLFICAGSLGSWIAIRRLPAIATIGLLLAAHAGASVRVAPHFLAFFNQLSGGPSQGWRHLVDSSLDWGQDLPGLKAWLTEHQSGDPVYLAYFGTGSPAYYRIGARPLPFVNHFKFPRYYVPLEAGLYCIGATMLQHVYSPIRGEWTLALEAEYQAIRRLAPDFVLLPSESSPTPSSEPGAIQDLRQALILRHDQLRFARLCHYLRVRKPDAHIGYSILIYRLTETEVTSATGDSLQEWHKLIENTVVP